MIGFTGTQKGLTKNQEKNLREFLSLLREKYSDFHHGDCIGADQEAHSLAKKLSYNIILHPPTNDSKRAFCNAHQVMEARSYMERNLKIVESCEILLATPKGMSEEIRSGTWSTVRKARKLGKKIVIFFPNGDIKRDRLGFGHN